MHGCARGSSICVSPAMLRTSEAMPSLSQRVKREPLLGATREVEQPAHEGALAPTAVRVPHPSSPDLVDDSEQLMASMEVEQRRMAHLRVSTEDVSRLVDQPRWYRGIGVAALVLIVLALATSISCWTAPMSSTCGTRLGHMSSTCGTRRARYRARRTSSPSHYSVQPMLASVGFTPAADRWSEGRTFVGVGGRPPGGNKYQRGAAAGRSGGVGASEHRARRAVRSEHGPLERGP